jgi:hypothetical protein
MPADCVSTDCLDFSPSLSHCFSFLLCRSSAAPSRSSSSTLSLGVPTENLFFCFRGILPQYMSSSLPFPQFKALLLVPVVCASTLGQTIFNIFLKHLFINVCRPLVVVCATLQFKDCDIHVNGNNRTSIYCLWIWYEAWFLMVMYFIHLILPVHLNKVAYFH